LKPTSMVTIAPRGRVGTTGAAAAVVPWVITSGSYTDSAPVRGLRIVAWTNAPRFTKLAMLHPEAAGVIPPVPVSCHGVDRPVALSGLAGTTMLQFTLATAVAGAVVEADGHGVAEAVAVAVAVAVAAAVPVVLAVGAAVAVAAAVGAAVVVPEAVGAAVAVVVPAPVAAPAVVAATLGAADVVAAAVLVVAAGLVVEVPTVDDVAGVDERQALATLAVLIAVPECEG